MPRNTFLFTSTLTECFKRQYNLFYFSWSDRYTDIRKIRHFLHDAVNDRNYLYCGRPSAQGNCWPELLFSSQLALVVCTARRNGRMDEWGKQNTLNFTTLALSSCHLLCQRYYISLNSLHRFCINIDDTNRRLVPTVSGLWIIYHDTISGDSKFTKQRKQIKKE